MKQENGPTEVEPRNGQTKDGKSNGPVDMNGPKGQDEVDFRRPVQRANSAPIDSNSDNGPASGGSRSAGSSRTGSSLSNSHQVVPDAERVSLRPPKYVLPKRETRLSVPETVTVLDGPGGSKVYLVGTAHFSEKSQQDVEEIIRKAQPNIVVLELCESRLSILSLDETTILEETKSMGMAKIRRHIQEFGLIQGVMYILLLTLSANLTKQLGMAPGGEFRRAFHEASKVPGCVVHLGDRPVHVTLRRAISSLSLWQKVKLAFGIIFNNESISKEEVERCKQRDLLEEMLKEMTGEFPALSTVFVHERDLYLAYSLWLASTPIPSVNSPTGFAPRVVVGVVGIGHVSGIVKAWGTVTDEDVKPLLKIPEPSVAMTLLRKTIRYSMLGIITWGAYRLLMPTAIHQSISTATVSSFNWLHSSMSNAIGNISDTEN